jgi:hypothetical protein
MEERKDAVDKRGADERLDANGLEQQKDIDTLGWQVQDKNAHIMVVSKPAQPTEHQKGK